MPSISSARVGVRIRGASVHPVRREAERPVAPAEQAEERLLALDRAGRGLHQVAVAHPDRAALLALAGLAPRELDGAAAAVHVEELEQVGERDLREPALELAVGLAVAPGRRRCARAARGAPRRGARPRSASADGGSTSSKQLVPRSRSGSRPRKMKRTPWARGLARRISASLLGVDQREVDGRDHGVRARRRAPPRARPRRGGAKRRREAARRARLADALRARRVPVGDQDRPLAAIPRAAPTRPPGCRDPGRAGRSGARRARDRTCGRASRGRPRRRARGAARRASPRRSRSGTAPGCRRGAARPT